MDFFKHQDIARRKSFLLVILFILSIVFLVAISNISVFSLYAYFSHDSILNFYKYWHLKTFLWITCPLVFTIFILTYLKLEEFKNIAKILHDYFDARLIVKTKSTSKEQKLLNIIEEISIASGIPPINAYVINDFTINSFVVGNSYEDASIVVTSASLEELSRDELQAMVAHEFAKIFSNDMNLNIKLTAITYSLLSISLIGKKLFNAISYSKKDADANDETSLIHIVFWILMAILGAFLIVFGFIGYILAKLITFLILRQRVYLNDSLTVEYIRNPIAFIRLLKMSSLNQSNSEYSELFEHTLLIQSHRSIINKIFNIYPDVRERINRLNEYNIYDLPIKENVKEKDSVKKEKKIKKEDISELVTGFVLLDNYEKVQSYGKIISQKKDSLSSFIIESLEDLEKTKALIVSMLLNKDVNQRKEQLKLIEDEFQKKLIIKAYEEISNSKKKYNLLVFYYSLEILKEMDLNSYRSFRNILNKIIYFDEVLDIFEWNIETIIVRQLDTFHGLRTQKEEIYFDYENVKYPLEVFLSVIAYSQELQNTKASECFESCIKLNSMNSLKLIEKEEISNQLLKSSIKELELCSYTLKKKILETCLVCLCFDNIIEDWEIELMYSISLLLQIPISLFDEKNLINK